MFRGLRPTGVHQIVNVFTFNCARCFETQHSLITPTIQYYVFYAFCEYLHIQTKLTEMVDHF